jgi:hypothetical protein
MLLSCQIIENMAHPRGKKQLKYINNKQRLTGTLLLTTFRAVPKLLANPIRPPGDKINPGTAATGPGLNTKSGLAIGRTSLSLNWGASQ